MAKEMLPQKIPDDATLPAALAKPVTTSSEASVAAKRSESNFDEERVESHS